MNCCNMSLPFCSLHELIEAFVTAIEAKDCYTRGHSDRVSDLSSAICRRIKLSSAEVSKIHIAAHLHDIGKIHIPDNILHKQGKLSDSEWSCVQLHSSVGYEILSKIRGFEEIADIVLKHHERWDGEGYPTGAIGNEIPLGARIIAVADSIDAMLSDRPYRKGMSWKDCKYELQSGSGIQFDPIIVPEAIFVFETFFYVSEKHQ